MTPLRMALGEEIGVFPPSFGFQFQMSKMIGFDGKERGMKSAKD
jgi:hypothetical protein